MKQSQSGSERRLIQSAVAATLCRRTPSKMPSQLTTTLAAQDDKLLACIHCGLCLEACPTYIATGDENDSPRGRIYLMRAVDEGRLASTSNAFASHIDRCLGCRTCEPVCPAGVEYGQLLESARAELFTGPLTLTLTQRALRVALRHVWLSSARLKVIFRCARLARDTGLVRLLLKSRLPRLLSKQIEFGLSLLESSKQSLSEEALSVPPASAGGLRGFPLSLTENERTHPLTQVVLTKRRDRTMLFKGCVTEGLFLRINQATARVLEVNGCATTAPSGQTCCGALHAHAGDLAGARQLAKQNMIAFADDDGAPIITNAGGCGAMLVSYAHLFADDEQLAGPASEFSDRVRDVSQQLKVTGIKEGGAIGSERITYDASCHLINGQHVGDAPLRLLEAIPDLRFVPLGGSDRCCGGAGVYNLMEPELSGQVLDEKLERICETGATIVATGNPGCHMQIGAGATLAGDSVRVCHPVELLDQSYRCAGYYNESEGNEN
jgi:glycolate oxidase iron-sulfur subunit